MNASFFSSDRKSILTWILVVIILAGGFLVSPLGSWQSGVSGNNLVVDALPDLSENRHVVICKLNATNPRTLEKSVTIPLSNWLLSQKGISEVQALTMNAKVFFYISMDEGPDFQVSYDKLADILDRMPAQIVPEDAIIEVGPPTSSVHQAFGFVLKQADSSGTFMPFLDPHELTALLNKEFLPELYNIGGVAEVAIAGGSGTEIQIIPDLDAMRSWGVTLESFTEQIEKSLEGSSSGAASFNGIEYFIEWDEANKDPGFFREMLIHGHEGTTALSGIAAVQTGPSNRNSLLIFEGHETSGAFISIYPDSDPSLVLTKVQERIDKVIQKWNQDNRTGEGGLSSHVFYNRMDLIQKNMSTLKEALIMECLIAVFILYLFMSRFRIALVLALMVPLTISMVFIIMYFTGIRLHILSVAGLILAIGTVVDFGIIFSQNVEEKLAQSENADIKDSINQSMKAVWPLFITSASIVIIAFIPVFLLEGTEGRMFAPLAWTKTLMMISALVLTLWVLPTLLKSVFNAVLPAYFGYAMAIVAAGILTYLNTATGLVTFLMLLAYFFSVKKPKQRTIVLQAAVLIFLIFYSLYWAPLGHAQLPFLNVLFGTCLIGGILLIMHFNQIYYKAILGFLIRHTMVYSIFIFCFFIAGIWAWIRIPASHLPVLNEGVFLHMPTLPHGSDISEVLDYGLMLDSLYRSVPEVSSAVIKAGPAASSMDPAPISMFENFISVRESIARDLDGNLIPAVKQENTYTPLDSAGPLDRLYRRSLPAWRPEIVDSEDLWNQISEKSHIGGLSHAPGLQPVHARMIMQETSIQSPYFVKISGAINKYWIAYLNLLFNCYNQWKK
ncbi:MAG: efflux RND transporter permease subunit [Saprospiraceae bacterium]|nr:efflux RND transporter permease subunit [Saprospiraceae bacterium]